MPRGISWPEIHEELSGAKPAVRACSSPTPETSFGDLFSGPGPSQGYDLQLIQYGDWLACDVLLDRDEHSPTSATGTAWERTPWHAAQRAAWDALKRVD